MTFQNVLGNYSEFTDHRSDYLERENLIHYNHVFHNPDHRSDYLERENLIDYEILIENLVISFNNINI